MAGSTSSWPTLELIAPRPKRAHQGWRYLEEADAPRRRRRRRERSGGASSATLWAACRAGPGLVEVTCSR